MTIKKQGVGKNRFDSTRSFSILDTNHKNRLEELKEIFEVDVNVTERFKFDDLLKMLKSIDITSTPRTVSMGAERMTETRGRRDADDR